MLSTILIYENSYHSLTTNFNTRQITKEVINDTYLIITMCWVTHNNNSTKYVLKNVVMINNLYSKINH